MVSSTTCHGHAMSSKGPTHQQACRLGRWCRRSVPKPSGSAPVGSPVALHGQLQTVGSSIVNDAQEPVQLRGVSLFWSQWEPEFWNAECVAWLADDWQDHNADNHLVQATAFFDEMAEVYGSYPNVIFETFNEPTNQAWSTQIKPYHEAVVFTIRQHTENLIILGSRSWDQEVEEASLDPVSGTHLAYAIHFYAGSASYASAGHGG